MVDAGLIEIRAAVDKHDEVKFMGSFETLTASCNACHQRAKVPLCRQIARDRRAFIFSTGCDCSDSSPGEFAGSILLGCGGASEDRGTLLMATPSPSIPPPQPSAEVLSSSGVLLFEDSAIDPWCGAVLVAADVVVTAAHCVEHRSIEKLAFTFEDQRSADAKPIRSVVIDPDWDAADLRFNLAALTLEEPIEEREPAEISDTESEPLWLLAVTVALAGEQFSMMRVEGRPAAGPEASASLLEASAATERTALGSIRALA